MPENASDQRQTHLGGADTARGPKDDEELIDESAEDSFPASDPPSFTPVSGLKRKNPAKDVAIEEGRENPPGSPEAEAAKI